MRNILLIVLLMCGFIACNDDDAAFDVPVDFQYLTFEPVPGGAIMRYKLPSNLDVFGVRVRYNDAFGKELYKDGSYLTDSLLLGGFTEARSEVPVQLCFFNRKMVETTSIEKTFSTKPAATVAIFDKLEVNPFWGGFNVTYQSPETVDGTIHVFYIGMNPTTRQLDSILMGSYPIVEGGDTLNFELKQKVDRLDVVVRTDDYEGHRVKLVVKEDVPNLLMDTLSYKDGDFKFKFMGNIVENEQYGFSEKYLFDGKKKGEGYRSHILKGESRVYDTFMAGPYAYSERFIFDFGTPQVPAALYVYAFLNLGNYYPQPGSGVLGELWCGNYQSRLPSKARVYGVKAGENPNTVDLSACTLLCDFKENNTFNYWRNYSWCKNTDNIYGSGERCDALTDAEYAAKDPIVLRLMCNYTKEEFQYVILVVEDTYRSNRYNADWNENTKEYVTFDEIDVVVQAKTERE